ncbi:CopG family ribbon-helix-helix protein [Aerosakkonema funiforme]|uniref:CopG family ribbon-helix-helix protein n=1 Tax=Aerosakkonema funiforme TaxID=1246630 RepID=UPI0035BA7ECC
MYRSDLLNKAIDSYLQVYQWQLDHIKEGLQQVEAGEFASNEEVAAAFARGRPNLSQKPNIMM